MPIELPKKLENKSCAPDKLVLLLAALEKKYGATSANYKLMSEMSDGEYTVSSLEHFFRDFRNAAKALLQKYPEATGDQPVAATPKKRKAGRDDDDDEADGNTPKSSKASVSPRKKRTAKSQKTSSESENRESTSELLETKIKTED